MVGMGNWLHPPPTRERIGIKTQSFQRIADPFTIWIFVLEKSMDEEDKALPSLSSSLSLVSSSSPSSSTAMMITSSSSSSPPVPANKKEKVEWSNEQRGCVIKWWLSPSIACPRKRRGWFQSEGSYNIKIKRGLLAELIDLLSKDYELNIIDSANNIDHTFACPKLPAIDPSKIQKNGSMLPSKLPGKNTEAPTKPHNASPTTYSASTETPFLPPERLKDYLCQNQCLQRNSLQWWMHQELVARANKKSRNILKLTLDWAFVHQNDVSECSPRAMELWIMAVTISPTKGNSRRSLCNGQRKGLMMK